MIALAVSCTGCWLLEPSSSLQTVKRMSFFSFAQNKGIIVLCCSSSALFSLPLMLKLIGVMTIRGQAEREFKVEVDAIGRVRHKNLVRLLGYCVEGAYR